MIPTQQVSPSRQLAEAIRDGTATYDDLARQLDAVERWTVTSPEIEVGMQEVHEAVIAGDADVLRRVVENPALLASVLAWGKAQQVVPLFAALEARGALDLEQVTDAAAPQAAPFALARAQALGSFDALDRVGTRRRELAEMSL